MPARKPAAPPKRYDPDQPAPALPKTNYSKRYDGARAVVDSGLTVPKLIEQLKNRMPTGEIFRRIRPKKLVELLQLHAIELEEKQRLSAAPAPPAPAASYHHMHSSIVFDDSPPLPPSPSDSVGCPFLLLDVRDEAEFDECHIQNAQCYPKVRLARATGQFSQEILSFRGHPKKVIVLYCDYGQTSGEAAQQFAERDFDNVFLLHGGLADFAAEFPDLVGPGAPPRPESPVKAGAAKVGASPRPPPAAAAAKKGPATRAAQAAAAPPGAKKVWK